MSKRPRSPSEVAHQIASLGVRPGDVVLAHVSYRAARPITGGPAGLLAGLQEAVGPQGTLVMPSSTGEDDRLFEPSATPADPDLGVVADISGDSPVLCGATTGSLSRREGRSRLRSHQIRSHSRRMASPAQSLASSSGTAVSCS